MTANPRRAGNLPVSLERRASTEHPPALPRAAVGWGVGTVGVAVPEGGGVFVAAAVGAALGVGLVPMTAGPINWPKATGSFPTEI